MKKAKQIDIKRLLSYLRGSSGLVVVGLLLALLSVSSKMAVPFVTGKAIDLIRSGKAGDSMFQGLLFLILGLILVGSLFRYLFDYIVSSLGQRMVKRMRDELYLSLSEAPLSYLDTHPSGDLLLRLVSDIENVQAGLITGAGALFEGAVQILITLSFMFALNWLLGIAVVLLTPISVVVSRFVSSRNSIYFKTQNAKLGELTSFTLESITNLEATKSYGLEEKKVQAFDSKNEGVRGANFKAAFAASWINPSTRLVNNIIYAAITIFGAYLLLLTFQDPAPDWIVSLGLSSFTVGGLSSFLTYSFQYMTPFNEISNVASEVFYATASFQRVQEAIDAPKDLDEGKRPLGPAIETLEAKHIDFSYDGSRNIISDFNFNVKKGHKIALVGPTGCGKTTIINILMRFYDPQSGGFYMNDVPTQEAEKKEMRSHIGMVLQDTWLKRGTIRENIAYSRPGASLEEVIRAAKKAHADEFIRRMPNGYDTFVSNASGLSTGEKQLLCVARILLAEPEIVLLDEATSNIDLRTELALAGAFDELMKGKTSLVVAHRLSTIKNADCILVLKDGAILESGNFAELMEKNGFFAELYRSQLS